MIHNVMALASEWYYSLKSVVLTQLKHATLSIGGRINIYENILITYY